jgi:hypothetical protein
MAINQALIELKAMLDAQIDGFLEEEGISENSARLLELKAKLDAQFDAHRRQNGQTRTASSRDR